MLSVLFAVWVWPSRSIFWCACVDFELCNNVLTCTSNSEINVSWWMFHHACGPNAQVWTSFNSSDLVVLLLSGLWAVLGRAAYVRQLWHSLLLRSISAASCISVMLSCAVCLFLYLNTLGLTGPLYYFLKTRMYSFRFEICSTREYTPRA